MREREIAPAALFMRKLMDFNINLADSAKMTRIEALRSSAAPAIHALPSLTNDEPSLVFL